MPYALITTRRDKKITRKIKKVSDDFKPYQVSFESADIFKTRELAEQRERDDIAWIKDFMQYCTPDSTPGNLTLKF
jgi:hypothetical protein